MGLPRKLTVRDTDEAAPLENGPRCGVREDIHAIVLLNGIEAICDCAFT